MLHRKNRLKTLLEQGQTPLGMWVTLEAPSITEIAVLLGVDWIVIDAEHGHLDFREIVEHLRVCNNSPTTALVRIQELELGVVKRALDLGADGIVIPNIADAAQAELAVQFAKYPPWGVRGVGGERATRWGIELRDYTRIADQETMVVPMIESVEAGKQAAAIASVRGVDAVFLGPVDYSASAGCLGEWEGPGVAEQLLEIKDRVTAQGIACGVTALDAADFRKRREQGFRLLSLGADTSLLIQGLKTYRRAIGAEPTELP